MLVTTSDNRKWFKIVSCQFFLVFSAMQLILVPAMAPYRNNNNNNT